MKKYISLFVLVFVFSSVVPQVALAAWWNPFSWGIFKRTSVETPREVPEPRVVDVVCTTDVRQCPDGSYVSRVAPACDFAACPTAKKPKPAPTTPTPKPLVNPVIPKPSVDPVLPKPATTSSTTTTIKAVEVPMFSLAWAFTPEGFIAPLTLKRGVEVLAVDAKRGADTQALGRWYTDSVTWRVTTDTIRSGDFFIAVYSGNVWIEDVSDAFNQSHTTKLSGHVASDDLSFRINSRVPSNGAFRVVVEKIEGRMKDDATGKVYTMTAGPLTSPEFRF